MKITIIKHSRGGKTKVGCPWIIEPSPEAKK